MNVFRQLTVNNVELIKYPFAKEVVMEAYLIENESVLALNDEEFSEVSILDSQVSLPTQGVEDGRIDILAKYGAEYLAIIEVKKDEINEVSLAQLERYLESREFLLSKNNDYRSDGNTPRWVGILVGTSISADLEKKLTDGYLYKDEIPVAGLVLNRYREKSNSDIFVITDGFFKDVRSKSGRDYSKYEFNGCSYGKGRLVNAVMKSYVEQNPEITFAELKQSFPDKIQGSTGVFQELGVAIDKYLDKRYYLNPEEVIKIKDATIATSTQWNHRNIEVFIKRASKLDLDINKDN